MAKNKPDLFFNEVPITSLYLPADTSFASLSDALALKIEPVVSIIIK